MKSFFPFLLTVPLAFAGVMATPTMYGPVAVIEKRQASSLMSVAEGLLSNIKEHTAVIKATALEDHAIDNQDSALVTINTEVQSIVSAIKDAVFTVAESNGSTNATIERRQDTSDPLAVASTFGDIVGELIKGFQPVFETFGLDFIKSLPVFASAFKSILPLLMHFGGQLTTFIGPMVRSLLPLLLGGLGI